MAKFGTRSIGGELGAAIVIDGATRRGAHSIAADFMLHTGVAIRGRTQPEEVYSLPLKGSSAFIGPRGVPAAKG